MAVLQVFTSGTKSTPKNTEKPPVEEKSTPQPHIDYPVSATDALPEVIGLLQEQWVDYCAVGGMMIDEGGTIKPMKVHEFAASIGVTRQTLNNWKKSIPDFEYRVRTRMKELNGGSVKLAKAWNGIYLATCAGKAEPAKLYFANFQDDFKLPTQKVENEMAGMGLAELMELASRRRAESAMEGEVIPQKAIDANHGS